MCLPDGGLRCVKYPRDIEVTRIPHFFECGYIMEVDLEYPEDLNHTDLPPATQNLSLPDSKQKRQGEMCSALRKL